MRDKLTCKQMNDRADAIKDDIFRTPEYLKVCGKRVELLLDMAINGDIPNGRFGDVECSIWSTMRDVLLDNGIKIRDI